MVTMNICLTPSINNVSFRGYRGCTSEFNGKNNILPHCTVETHFMRDLDSSTYVVDYLKKKFPEGAHIADWGCSKGYETYSFATLLNNVNKNSKYKITGYDIVPENISDAKKGVFSIGTDKHESFLTNNRIILTDEQAKIKRQFEKCFDKKSENTYIPKLGTFDNIVDFKLADIFDIKKKSAGLDTSAVIFKNSLYHLLDIQGYSGNEYLGNRPKIRKLFCKINSVLPKDGLFVLGSLPTDHNFTTEIPTSEVVSKYQKGKLIKVFENSPIHEILREVGFEPVFYDCYKHADGKVSKVYLPSVWKKIKNVI